MIMIGLRFIGFVAAAAAFVTLVIDAARAMANGVVAFMPFGAVAFQLLGPRFTILQPAVERHVHPFLWDYVLQPLFLLPAFAVFGVFGFALMWIARDRHPRVGFDPRA